MNPNPKKFSSPDVEKSPIAQNEEKILDFWREQNIFQKTLEKDAPMGDYNFFEGPPTANGRPGIHHVLARSFKDIIPRYKTMRGFRVQRKAGWDTHGLPVELQVEKQLGLKSKKEIEQFGLAVFNQRCRESVWEYKDEWEQLTQRMGYWIDMEHPYVTYHNSYIEALWGTVKKIDERGFLYKDFRVGPWCSRCGTGLSSHELNQPGAYKDVKDLTAYVKFKVKNQENTYILAWTTTPWTLPGNIALAIGSKIDYVYVKTDGEILIIAKNFVEKIEGEKEIIKEINGSELAGFEYEPLYPFMETLMGDDQKQFASWRIENAFKVYPADFVTDTDGTGIVHIAPMYGADDFEFATKNNLPKFHVVNEEGKYITGCDTESLQLSGRYVKEKDENGKPTLAVDIIDDLTARGLLLKKENYTHSYPHCWRCDTPLLYYARTSWYFKMSALRDQLLEANKTINWEPDHVRDGRFGEWLDGIKDWAISRDRYWGTPLPIWQTESGKRLVIGGLSDIKKHVKKSGNTYTVVRHAQAESNAKNTWDFMGDPNNHLTDIGKDQAMQAGQQLQGQTVDVIIASPILRVQETAKIIAEQIGYDPEKIITDKRVIEWQVGSEFQGKDLQSFLDIRNASENRYTFKLSDGESFQDVVDRCGEFLYELEQTYQGKNIVIVCHNSSAKGLFLAGEGFTYADLLKNNPTEYRFGNAEIRTLDFTPLPHNDHYELDLHKPYIDQVLLELDGELLVRTPEVMDVWFDSGAMPIAQHHQLGQELTIHPLPADYISEGVDQTRGWFYTMHAISNLLHDTPTQAYKNVVCLGLVLDANGQKMSKSKGNVVSPWDMFEKYGADVIRFWFYSVNQPGDFKNFDEQSIDEVRKKVFNPLMNIVSFYEMYAKDFSDIDPYISTNVLDQWVLTLWNKTLSMVIHGLENYQLIDSARAIKEFITELSQWYIRRSRDRFKSSDSQDVLFALATTRYIIREIAKAMAPFAPFIAEDIWQKFGNSESVHLEEYPKVREYNTSILEHMEQVRSLVTLGLEARQKVNIKVRQPLASITISGSLPNEYLEILQDELNVKQVIVNQELEKGVVELDTEITETLRDEGDMRDLVRKVQDMRKSADLVPSDRVIVSLTQEKPNWFDGELGIELLETVGAKEILWGSSQEKLEKI